MSKSEITKNYTNLQTFLLVALRIVIGWYFLYEGLVKIVNPDWSSFGYLMDSQGMFAGLFHSMAAKANVVAVVDFLNKWGLTFIGLGLMLGAFTQLALFFGIVLLIMYYLSHPPLASIFTMAVLMAFPTGHIIGLDRFISKWFKKQ